MLFGPRRSGFLLAPIALPCLLTEIPVSTAHGSLSQFLVALHDAADLLANWATSGNSYRALLPQCAS